MAPGTHENKKLTLSQIFGKIAIQRNGRGKVRVFPGKPWQVVE